MESHDSLDRARGRQHGRGRFRLSQCREPEHDRSENQPDLLRPRHLVNQHFSGQGFNPLTATVAELNANNYPARPARRNVSAYAQWKRFAVKPAATRSSCAGLHQASRNVSGLGQARAAAAQPADTTAPSPSQNWAGYVAHNNTYSDALAEWTLPTATGVSGTDDYSSSWVGIGLGNSSPDPLMQAGSESDWLNGTPQYYMWLQVFPEESKQQIVDFGVNGGDAVGVHVTYTTSGPEFHLWDTTRSFNKQFQVGGSWKNDGHAEWIYERTAINKEYPYLADAAPTFTSAQATVAGAQFPLDELPSVPLDMYNCPETQVIADPGAISGESFAEHYLHHGDQNQCP
jgi:hypothetical protein